MDISKDKLIKVDRCTISNSSYDTKIFYKVQFYMKVFKIDRFAQQKNNKGMHNIVL